MAVHERVRGAGWVLAGLVLIAGPVAAQTAVDRGEIQWLEEQSMLHQAGVLAAKASGAGRMWRHPFGESDPAAATRLSSVWFTAYPAAMITRKGQSVVASLGDDGLWKVFEEIGITGVHTGPMKKAGGLDGRKETPTIDGMFDRISMDIDASFGTVAEYQATVKRAAKSGAVVIGDIIPGHTGQGADFQLAVRAHRDYPGLYHMVEIPKADWGLLPEVPAGRRTVNLGREAVDKLEERGHIVGRLSRTIFYEKGVKETDWSATGPVVGVDGVERRWVYLHYFKEGQPSLNWLDPSFAAERLVLGDALHSLDVLGERVVRLDANGFLGVEIRKGEEPAWSEGHPLATTANQLIGGMIRKLGGFSFQELNLTLEDIARSRGGADLSYDFVTRPAYQHALVTGDAWFLRLMIELGAKAGIPRVSLIHALQNHDELTLELVHFWTTHKDEMFGTMTGGVLRDKVRAEMLGALVEKAPYNLKASNGVSCTTVSLVAAALGVRDVWAMSEEDKRRVQAGHTLLALYNAMQPGVFAISGWDLVGALPLRGEQVKERMGDGDTRWINRGAIDLLGAQPDALKSADGLPRAEALYGALPAQLARADSFASSVKAMLAARKRIKIAEAVDLPSPAVKAKGLVVMAHRLPGGEVALTALNFGREPVAEDVAVEGVKTWADVLANGAPAPLPVAGQVGVKLEALSGKVWVLK